MSDGEQSQYKTLRVHRFGWRRIVKNTLRFGWRLVRAEQETEITTTVDYYEARIKNSRLIDLTPHTTTTSKTANVLYFYRNKSEYSNLFMIAPLEWLYSIIYIFRKISAWLVPIAIIATIALVLLGFYYDNHLTVDCILGGTLITWIALMLLENILSIIASWILRKKR